MSQNQYKLLLVSLLLPLPVFAFTSSRRILVAASNVKTIGINNPVSPRYASPKPSASNDNFFNDFDEIGEFEEFSSPDKSLSEGSDLASEFFKQIRIRNERDADDEEQELLAGQKSLSTKNTEAVGINMLSSTSSQSKFTGRETSEIDSSSSLNPDVYSLSRRDESRRMFSNDGADLLSAKDRIMGTEFDLLRIPTSSTSIIFQAILSLAFLGYAIFVGMSGGITNGADRFGQTSEFNGGLELPDVQGIAGAAVESIEGVITGSAFI